MENSNLLREAAAWRLISLFFECPSDDWQEQLGALALECDDANLREAAAMASNEANDGLFHTTFGPGGPAAPREVSYRPSIQPGQFLAQLELIYEAFAYRPLSTEAPDHIAVLTGFMSYLRLKEAYALANENAKNSCLSHDAASKLIEEHLAYMAEPLADSLSSSGVSYLAIAGAALFKRVGPRPQQGTLSLPIVPENPDECSIECDVS